VELALHSDLFSYILLIPLIAAYLIWLRRKTVPSNWEAAWKTAGVALGGGVGLLVAYWWRRHSGWVPAEEDSLAIMVVSFLLLLLGATLALLGGRTMRAIAFPAALMLLMVPCPAAILDGINLFFDQTSAFAAAALFRLSGTPLAKDGLELHLPGCHLFVAPECSGVHSTLVLLIISLLVGNLFLRARWKRAVLTAFVLPLAIARNGFRIWIIGELCVHISPRMIDSPIHHRGGPLFFVLSLIPMYLLLLILRKSELRPGPTSSAKGGGLTEAPV
jgi:exosortase C (VPDSG-CTERM-specific)